MSVTKTLASQLDKSICDGFGCDREATIEITANAGKTWYDEEAPSCWMGLTSNLLDILNDIAIKNHIRTDHKIWPQSADSLTKKLKIISSNLREGLGINISITKVKSGGKRGLSITRVSHNALHASTPYQTTFDAHFQSTDQKTETAENNPVKQIEPNLG